MIKNVTKRALKTSISLKGNEQMCFRSVSQTRTSREQRVLMFSCKLLLCSFKLENDDEISGSACFSKSIILRQSKILEPREHLGLPLPHSSLQRCDLNRIIE